MALGTSDLCPDLNPVGLCPGYISVYQMKLYCYYCKSGSSSSFLCIFLIYTIKNYFQPLFIFGLWIYAHCQCLSLKFLAYKWFFLYLFSRVVHILIDVKDLPF